MHDATQHQLFGHHQVNLSWPFRPWFWQWSLQFFMSSPLCSVVEVCMFSGCPSTASVRSSGQILLPRYLMNDLSNLDEIYREYSPDPTADVLRFWRSKVKVTAGRRCGEGSRVDAGASKSHLLILVWCPQWKCSVEFVLALSNRWFLSEWILLLYLGSEILAFIVFIHCSLWHMLL